MAEQPPTDWDRRTDVVVVGSGTGMAAALAASGNGADVLVLEKSPFLGGTTAISGGGAWVGNADPVVEEIGETPREELMNYLRRTSGGRTSDEMLERFLDRGPEVYRTIAEETALEFVHTKGFNDYHLEWEGGHPEGRMIEPDHYDGDRLGEQLEHVRASPQAPVPVQYKEMEEAGGTTIYPTIADYEMISQRMQNNVLTSGRAFIAGLYEALLDRGVEFEREAPATELVVDDDEVVGVVAEIDGTETYVEATGGVIIAAGGLEWDEEMRENFLRGPVTSPASPPYNEGDGIEMGAEIGAKLGNMDEAWWFPTLEIPGEQWEDGSQVSRIPMDRILPGAILVNENGERFANESDPYNDLGKRFHEFDPTSYEYENVPAYQVMDHDFREQYAIGGQVLPEDDLPNWVQKADTLAELAEKLGIDPVGLEETVAAFNEHAREGRDPEFHSGENAYDRHMGDPNAEHPTLAPLDEPPFYAFEMHPGTLGSKGGLVTNTDAEVVDYDDDPIPGLYASSNGTKHIMGIGYCGGGATIGPNVTFGYIAGENAAERAQSR